MKHVSLKNGDSLLESLVQSIMGSLQLLLEEKDIPHAMAFHGLTMLCRDPAYPVSEIPAKSIQILKDAALMDEAGQIHSAIRSVVLSAVEGEGHNMILSSPLAE